MNLRKQLRKHILPMENIISVLKNSKYRNVLDVGSGTGLFLEELYLNGIISNGIGVDINPKYHREINKELKIVGPGYLDSGKKFDLIMFNDVLHHTRNKILFLTKYINTFLTHNGYIFIKEMNNKDIFCKYFNRLHDLIVARQLISEISQEEVLEELGDRFYLLASGSKRIFLYDHYFIFLRAK